MPGTAGGRGVNVEPDQLRAAEGTGEAEQQQRPIAQADGG
jgi:hypothetical protein